MLRAGSSFFRSSPQLSASATATRPYDTSVFQVAVTRLPKISQKGRILNKLREKGPMTREQIWKEVQSSENPNESNIRSKRQTKRVLQHLLHTNDILVKPPENRKGRNFIHMVNPQKDAKRARFLAKKLAKLPLEEAASAAAEAVTSTDESALAPTPAV